MNSRSIRHGVTAAWTAASLAALCPSSMASAGATEAQGSAWTANGATACGKYLTPDVTAAILVAPAGPAQRLDANTCHAGIIYISLKVANVEVFRQEIPRIAGAHRIAGIGDAAYWNEAGALSSAKGLDRGCDISIVGVPQQMKIHNAELGQKLGEICNKLFALP